MGFCRAGFDLMFIQFPCSGLYVPIDEEFAFGFRSCQLLMEAAFLPKHGIFGGFNPNTESWPTPPKQEQSEHNR